MKLQRKWARLLKVIVALTVFALFWDLLIPVETVFGTDCVTIFGKKFLIVQLVSFLTLPLLAIGFWILKKKLSCPNCGKDTINLFQKPGVKKKCAYCGTPMIFDDEIEMEE